MLSGVLFEQYGGYAMAHQLAAEKESGRPATNDCDLGFQAGARSPHQRGMHRQLTVGCRWNVRFALAVGQRFHLIEHPIDGVCRSGPRPVATIWDMASISSRFVRLSA